MDTETAKNAILIIDIIIIISSFIAMLYSAFELDKYEQGYRFRRFDFNGVRLAENYLKYWEIKVAKIKENLKHYKKMYNTFNASIYIFLISFCIFVLLTGIGMTGLEIMTLLMGPN